MLPRVTMLQHQEQRAEIAALIVRVMRKLAIVYLPVYAFLLVTGREFITALFTDRFVDSLPVFLVNLTFVPLAILVNDPVLRAYPEQRHFLLKLRVVLLGVLVVALQIGTSQFGLVGAISAVVAIAVVERAIITWRVMRVLQIRHSDLAPLADVGRIAVCAAAGAGVAAVTRSLTSGEPSVVVLVVCALAFGATYFGALLALKVPNGEEAELAQRHWSRLRRRLGVAT
jgi:O-antigen/teichoic acid export membrane protein